MKQYEIKFYTNGRVENISAATFEIFGGWIYFRGPSAAPKIELAVREAEVERITLLSE